MRAVASFLVVGMVAGCATTMDPNYALQIEAYRATISAQHAVEIEKARAESARYEAIASIASFGDQSTRNMALVALALSGRDGGSAARVVNVTLPSTPETADARAYKWAALFGPTVAVLAQGYFGYKLGTAQINANRDTTMASYGALGSLGRAGFAANDGIAQSGFAAVRGIGGDAFLTIERTRPTVTQIGGDGVIGSGSYSFTGPNSGDNSGNTGHIGNQDRNNSADNPVPVPTAPTGP